MKRIVHALALGICSLAALAAVGATPAFAQSGPEDKGNEGAAKPSQPSFQLVSCSGVDDPRTKDVTETPCDYNQVIFTIARIIRYAFYLSIPILLGMMVLAGFKYMTAGGDASLVADAKRMFKPIIIGILLMLGSYLIVYKLILGNLLADQVGDIKKEDIINEGRGF